MPKRYALKLWRFDRSDMCGRWISRLNPSVWMSLRRSANRRRRMTKGLTSKQTATPQTRKFRLTVIPSFEAYWTGDIQLFVDIQSHHFAREALHQTNLFRIAREVMRLNVDK